MNEKYKQIQWVVQRNLTSQSDFEQLKESCHKIGVAFIELDIIPFTAKLPNFDRSRNSIIYGSTTFNGLAFEDANLRKGLFFNEVTFSIENYIEKWGGHMLNDDASVITFEELIDGNNYSPDKLLFIRPNDDSKSFAGEVKPFEQISDWYEKLKAVENTNLSLESKIIVSEPYNIHYEWRLWIVNKKVVAASKYREYFKLKKDNYDDNDKDNDNNEFKITQNSQKKKKRNNDDNDDIKIISVEEQLSKLKRPKFGYPDFAKINNASHYDKYADSTEKMNFRITPSMEDLPYDEMNVPDFLLDLLNCGIGVYAPSNKYYNKKPEN
jgi:hypothetical protein